MPSSRASGRHETSRRSILRHNRQMERWMMYADAKPRITARAKRSSISRSAIARPVGRALSGLNRAMKYHIEDAIAADAAASKDCACARPQARAALINYGPFSSSRPARRLESAPVAGADTTGRNVAVARALAPSPFRQRPSSRLTRLAVLMALSSAAMPVRPLQMAPKDSAAWAAQAR